MPKRGGNALNILIFYLILLYYQVIVFNDICYRFLDVCFRKHFYAAFNEEKKK